MTGAERVDRWRKRHARKLARKAARRGGQRPMPWEGLLALIPSEEDVQGWFIKSDQGPPE